jgi:2-polyprenyl-3-methyl-5-hydroxy-6-metoxy-1,4-benzoquinol methylase
MKPVDVLTSHTMEFVTAALPGAGLRLLEVGAGNGHLARALMDAGHGVVAVDASEKAVARARELGVDARHADWHDFEDGTFDAILFTRSLHHIDRLQQAIDRCWPMLTRDGRVLLEEVSFADVDPPTAQWLGTSMRELAERGAIDIPPKSFLTTLLAAPDTHAWWHDHHGHMHQAQDIRTACLHEGRIVDDHAVVYLYRYFAGLTPPGEPGVALLEELKRLEQSRIDTGEIRAVGRRLVIAHKEK